MNIVKGVADLIRRTSSGQGGESSSGHRGERFYPPSPKIHFSEHGDEAVLKALWDKLSRAIDKVEKKKLFHVFLKKFLVVFKNWEPANGGQLPESGLTAALSSEYPSSSTDGVVGCSAGHPAEVIGTLIEEVVQMTLWVTEFSSSLTHGVGIGGVFTGLSTSTFDALLVLDALIIVTRSMHNCRTLGYYGGIVKLTALMKGAVIQMKTISWTLTADESLSKIAVEKANLLQKILVSVVSIICGFIAPNLRICGEEGLCSDAKQFSVPRDAASPLDTFGSLDDSNIKARVEWHQKAILSVMEAGGLNWLVELLRVIRKLGMKEQWMETTLQYLTLRTLFLALSNNPRGQSHFKSIGGLEVLLDGLGLPSFDVLSLKLSSYGDDIVFKDRMAKLFQLHVLCLEVLREAVFCNVNNLQFLCENGRVHKFANSFCSPAFMLQEYKQAEKDTSMLDGLELSVSRSDDADVTKSLADDTATVDKHDRCGSFSESWDDYVTRLSKVLCSFLLVPEDAKLQQMSTSPISTPLSSLYTDFSIKWVMRVLITVFSCLKACSKRNELPDNLRIFVKTLQHSVLSTFRKILDMSPVSLEVFREEGIWDFVFSENFFYWEPVSEEISVECYLCGEGLVKDVETASQSNIADNQVKCGVVGTLKMEVVSFVEFAATLKGIVHNLPEASVLLDALEQSACCPECADILAKSLVHILQISQEKTVASFKSLDAASRVLKVACVQARELRRIGRKGPLNTYHQEGIPPYHPPRSDFCKMEQSWLRCMGTCMELFMEFFSSGQDARVSILRSSMCVDCLFELFWEQGLRNNVLEYILDIMKIVPLCEEDQKAKSQVCSKYLETFTQIKERERNFCELAVQLLAGVREMIQVDALYYQALFRDGECFLHVVSLLNGNLDEADGEKLVLSVLQTLTCMLAGNDASKATFRALAGKGYQTLQSLLLDFYGWQPGETLLNALLDMLVDGKFDVKGNSLIKNEDVIILYLSVLQKSSAPLRYQGLNLLQQLLRESISNRASCVRAGMLNFLLDWFSREDNEDVVMNMAQVVQLVGGHSVSGKDIRKIFALLRSENVGSKDRYHSLLLTCVFSMLNEKGPSAFFDMNGIDSGITIKNPVQWPVSKGFSFSCWLRIESFFKTGKMGLFSFLTENGKGCFAVLAKDSLFFVSANLKRQCIRMHVSLVSRKWHFLCITHSIGRPFSGGSLLRCYLDGDIVASERCSYARVSDLLGSCSVGTRIFLPQNEENEALELIQDMSPFCGQIGPVYLFNDAISLEQVKAIYILGPSYMYSFLENETAMPFVDTPLPSGILDPKDGLASKIIFGINAQASHGRKLFNVAPVLENVSDKTSFEASVLLGTQLCSRRLLQETVYCVGGISVFFPLITQFNKCEDEEDGLSEHNLVVPVSRNRQAAEVIQLIASVLDENLANQQQMHTLSGFPILGFLLQSVPPEQLNMEMLSALKHLFGVVTSSGLPELLVQDAICSIFLNPLIWLYTLYEVQRELYMFLIQQFDNVPRLLRDLCPLPRVVDIIRQFYWDTANSRSAIGSAPLLHPVTKQVIGERPSREEIRKLRLLLLSVGEMSLRQNITAADVKALIAFFETSEDMTCIEDVLHMAIRSVSQASVLASFLEQVNFIGGCCTFINLLQRDYEPIRLLGLQFLGRLLVGLPCERRGLRIFNLAVGRSKSILEDHKRNSLRMQPIFLAISDRLFRFPLTDNLCATLFDILLGGASPKQVLQKQNQLEKQKGKGSNSHFLLPQTLVLIFKFLSGCKDRSARTKIISDLLDLLDSNSLNIEALMDYGWSSWLSASTSLDVIKEYRPGSGNQDDSVINEQSFVRSLYCVALSYYILSVKGGWQHLEDTVNFLLVQDDRTGISCRCFLHDIYEDLIRQLVELPYEDNILTSQPCRDNVLYLLQLVDEMLVDEISTRFLLPAISAEFSLDLLELETQPDYVAALDKVFEGAEAEQSSRNSRSQQQASTDDFDLMGESWWNLYDNLWLVICYMNGKGSTSTSHKSSVVGPSIGQRARGFVESLNIPAAEMAAVVSGGIGNALGGKVNKNIDKAMLLRGERCPRIVFRLVIVYLCRASLERASKCVQQFISLLPSLLASDDEQSKGRLHYFIGALLVVRSQYGVLDDGARFHVISHVIRETIDAGKAMLVTSVIGKDDSGPVVASRETGSVRSLILKDRVLSAVSDEATYIKTLKIERTRQLEAQGGKMEEARSLEFESKRAFEDDLQSGLDTILASDESRRAAFRLSFEERHQNIAEKWIRMMRSLMDERGPWSANPFPNNIIKHWKHDKTEDSWRRRPKLRQNYHFDKRLCQPPAAAPESDSSTIVSESKSSLANVPERMRQFLLKGVRRITDEGSLESSENDSEQSGQKSLASDELPESEFSELAKGCSDSNDMQERVNTSTSFPKMEASEVLTSVPCVLVTPKRKLAGTLAVMKNALHFFGEFLVEGTGGSAVFKTFHSSAEAGSSKPDQKRKYVKWPLHFEFTSERWASGFSAETENFHQKELTKVKRHRRWNTGKVKAVHWTRFLLRYTAIEVFFSDSMPPIFLNFRSQKHAKEIGNLIVATRNELLIQKGNYRDKGGVISFVDRRVALEMAEIARERWRRRDITNFEYLMILNTLAGRSYNDLTQYPIFPWVLADYSSEVLDFNKASTFRDLTKPVGALDAKRFEVFEDRYHSFSDPDIPSFFYGSHYSTMGIVLYYLLRLEPFTSLHRNLQGGKFDHADRLFQSVEGTFRNCLSNTSDVKELIPEFFYMSEFLVNSNFYHLGVKQDGEPIGDVCLPPWAKGSPELFITRNREALESEYVSSNLHNWIDLIFGYKQRGKSAVESANVFYYLTYEGAVDLENLEDELQIAAIEDQIANFGQTPIQIFRKKHPRRGPPMPIMHPLYFAPASIDLTSVVSVATHPTSAVLYAGVLDSHVVLVNQGLTLSIKMWLTTQLQFGGNFTFSGSQDPFFGVGSDVLCPRNIGSPLDENVELGSQCFATIQSPFENFLVSSGNWENSFQVISLNDGRVVQSVRHHKDVVSCVAASADSRILASGSYDTTVMIWEVVRVRSAEKRVRNMQTEYLRKEYVVSESPLHILCGHDDIVTCLFVSVELDIVVSGSKDGTCIFHTLREARYIRSLQHPSGSAISKLVGSRHGRIVIYADDDLTLHLYSINGKHLASSESNGRLNCLELSQCNEFLVCAGDQGQIIVRSMNTLDIVRRYNGVGKIITSLTVTAEECFLAGTKDGSLLVYSIENPQLRRARLAGDHRGKR